jgi:pimeloyl-ACP methyl ester carboxylesterase
MESAAQCTRSRLAAILLLLWIAAPTGARAGTQAPLEGFVAANGIRVEYLDWGGAGPALILIHGLGDDPHCFDDLAAALTDRFHVFAYARRGSGNSEVKGPYDDPTLVEDLRGLMDALGIDRAHLAGHSAGGNEITAMAGRYPMRVGRLVYLDAGYDFADPQSVAAFKMRPAPVRPASATSSMDAYRAYEIGMLYPKLDDVRRIEAYLRRKVVIQQDASVKDRIPQEVRDELYAALFRNRREYTRVRSPVLAIYPEHWYPPEVADPLRRKAVLAYDPIWARFRAKSIARLRREIADVQIVHVPGAHSNFMLMSRQQVADAMRAFLSEFPETCRAGARCN